VVQWKFRPRYYPHFDHAITHQSEALALIKDFQSTGCHTFLPFLESPLELRRFTKYLEKLREIEAGNDVEGFEVNKPRPIKYASHQDSQIFSYYRTILAEKYEAVLRERGLDEFPIAYRKIPVQVGSPKGKCNIHFAKEAFDEVVRRGNCVAITLDVSGFFESLDHAFLERKWCEVMGLRELPVDHKAVFKAVTDYRLVDKDACYENLGLITWDGSKRKYLQCPFYIFRKKKMLCDKNEYREKIVGKGLVKKNEYKGTLIPQGVPQGSPISDILANIYMLDFDAEMAVLARQHGAYYRRYSDDILWICSEEQAEGIKEKCQDAISRQGQATLALSAKKTTVTHFQKEERTLSPSGDAFSYLGFSFDGQKALYRDKTISGYERKTTFGIRSFVRRAYEDGIGNQKKKITGNGKSLKQNLNVSQIFHKIGFPNKDYVARQREDDERVETNFMTYHLRALHIFNANQNASYFLSDKQLRDYKTFIRKKILEEAKKFDPVFVL